MADQPPAFVLNRLRLFVCCRITNLTQVDLDRYRFDFDLTFSTLFMNSDGTIYHHFGSRDHRSPDSRLNFESFVRVADAALAAHRIHRPTKVEPTTRPSRTIWDFQPYAARVSRDQCVHCHHVFPAEREAEKAKGRWSRERIWVFPDPARLGVDLDPRDHTRVARVDPRSPADAAGLQVGDRWLRLAGSPIASIADVQAHLDRLPYSGGDLEVEFLRESVDSNGEASPQRMKATLRLERGWRQATPLEFSWRPSKWTLTPQPGFGGRFLNDAQRKRLGVSSPLAYQVTYIVDWGPRAKVGRAVKQAGLRKGDIVTAIDGRTDFASPDHVHAWVRLAGTIGKPLRLSRWRDGAVQVIEYELLP